MSTRRPYKYTKEMLEPLVKESTSFSQVVKKLGLGLTGGNQVNIKNKIKLFDINTSHFKAQGWSKGLTKETSSIVAKQAIQILYTDDVVFSNGNGVTVDVVRRRFKKIVEYKCFLCDLLPVWNGKPLSLHMDHKNGNRTDNRKKNLRWLCPNCHQQTETWGNPKNTQA